MALRLQNNPDPRLTALGGLQVVQGFDQMGSQLAAQARNEQIRQALSGVTQPQQIPQTQQTQQLAEQSLGLGGEQAQAEQQQTVMTLDEMKQQALSIDPALAKQQFKLLGIDSASKRAEASREAARIQGLPFNLREQAINERVQNVLARGGNPKDSMELLDMNEGEQNQALSAIQMMDLSTKDRLGFISKGKQAQLASAGQREFENLISSFTEEEKKEARRVKAGLKARKVGSAVQTITEEGTVEAVSATESTIAADKESAVGDVKGIQNRINTLEASKTGRIQSVKKAKKFINLFEKRNISTGAGRKALSYLPGVYSDQGRLDEEFNSFAEVAARQTLKANGETKPTDADVEGMKRAMFGIGRDESVNLILLEDYLEQQEADNTQLKNLKSGRRLVNRRNSKAVDDYLSSGERAKDKSEKDVSTMTTEELQAELNAMGGG